MIRVRGEPFLSKNLRERAGIRITDLYKRRVWADVVSVTRGGKSWFETRIFCLAILSQINPVPLKTWRSYTAGETARDEIVATILMVKGDG